MFVVENASPLHQLARAVEAGDLDEILRLAWSLHRTAVLARFRSLGLDPHECEEALQEVFATMVVEWDRYDGADLGAWLHALARCEAMTSIQDRQRRRNRPAAEWDPPAYDLEERLVGREQLAAVAAFRAALTPAERRILDSTLTTTTDEELRAALAGDLGVELTLSAIWSKRMEIRQLLYLHTGREVDDGT